MQPVIRLVTYLVTVRGMKNVVAVTHFLKNISTGVIYSNHIGYPANPLGITASFAGLTLFLNS